MSGSQTIILEMLDDVGGSHFADLSATLSRYPAVVKYMLLSETLLRLTALGSLHLSVQV